MKKELSSETTRKENLAGQLCAIGFGTISEKFNGTLNQVVNTCKNGYLRIEAYLS